MKKAEMQPYKERLLALRARVCGDVNAMADVALNDAHGSNMPIHMAELGSENYEQEFTLSLMQTEEGVVEAIDEALGRIEKGTYGRCVDCDAIIPKARLNAIPYTPLCLRCAEMKEST